MPRGDVVIEPTIKEQILKDLDRLSLEQQRKAQQLVHGLVAPGSRGASIEDLIPLNGILDKESAREMKAAIEEHCERVDPSDW
jgi:hypothetical protein